MHSIIHLFRKGVVMAISSRFPTHWTLGVAVASIAMAMAGLNTADAGAPAGWGCQGGPGCHGGITRSIRPTPPYFAMHPPVYYGGRYSRPYGLSPFAAGSMLQPTPTYHGRLASDMTDPAHGVGGGGAAPRINPCCGTASTHARSARGGQVQYNPFVETRLASK